VFTFLYTIHILVEVLLPLLNSMDLQLGIFALGFLFLCGVR
jgi:hypothetical protein